MAIVGAGLAGSAAAYVLAKAGLEVLLLERGNTPGSKAMSGGRIYAYSLRQVWPEFAASAPLQRQVVRETISMVTPDSMASFDLFSADLATACKDSYTVLRQDFDAWAASQAEEAGANLICAVKADELFYKNGKLAGVMAGGEEVEAKMVILAEGANGHLAREAGLKKELTPHQVGVGFKEVIELPEEVINDRFALMPGQGAARLFAGSLTGNLAGSGGFLYTNKDSLSLGMVINVAAAAASTRPVHELLEDFKSHPAMRPLLAGGKTAEYSAHLVPEAGFNMLPRLCANNLLVAGDAAGMVINHGYTVRGMDLAVASGLAAARAVLACKGNYSASALGPAYESELERVQVLPHLRAYRHMPEFVDMARLASTYPQLTVDLFKDAFIFDGSPATPLLLGKVLPRLRKVGFLNLLKDGWKAKKAL